MTQTPQYYRNLFTGIPVEFHVPDKARVVVVSDFFEKDLSGGAEMTLEALLKSSPTGAVSRLHSTSLTPEILNKNKDKTWIIANYTLVSGEVIEDLANSTEINCSIIEFDFKFCAFRSTYRHMLERGTPCDCQGTQHGQVVEKLYRNAKNLFWMSERQKAVAEKAMPTLKTHLSSTVLSSVFDKETLAFLAMLRTRAKKNPNKVAMLSGGTWIKGVEQTEEWCKLHKLDYVKVGSKDYRSFLSELSSYGSFVFRPLDYDTCPRAVIEAKLLGLGLRLNENVLHQSEPWFALSEDGVESYLRTRPEVFWNKVFCG